jgi:hypothetical protein
MSFDSSLNITLDSNHDAVFNVSGNERLRIDSLGNVGIGTTSPGSKLDVDGSIRGGYDSVTTSYFGKTAIGATTTYSDQAYFSHINKTSSGEYALIQESSGATLINSADGQNISFTVNNDTKMILDSNGNIGIGTTSPATHLSLGVNSDSIPFVVGSYNSSYPPLLNIRDDTYDDAASIAHFSRGNSVFQITAQGFYHQRGTGDIATMNTSSGHVYFGNSSRSSYIRFNTDNNILLETTGNVGIGTTSPRGLLDILDVHGLGTSGSEGLYYRRSGFYYGWRFFSRHNRSWDFVHQADNDIFYVYFENTTSRGGYFDPNYNSQRFDFTGQHRGFVENIPSTESEDYKGLIVSANKNTYYDIDYSIKTGKDAIKINESLPYVSLCKKEKDKSVYGVISDGEEGETRNDSGGTFVSVSEKQYGDNRIFINALGEGAIWVSNKNGNLESGDYITSSAIPGYGQKQDSESLKNYTVAKITMDCDFQPDYIYKKKVTTRNVDITGPDTSGNYYDILNNERLYTIDLSNEIIDNKNKKYMLTFDSANNLIGATQNVLDEKGQVQWEDTSEQEYAYEIRHVDPSGIVITKEQHDSTISNGGSAYIAAFVGCTYHCG